MESDPKTPKSFKKNTPLPIEWPDLPAFTSALADVSGFFIKKTSEWAFFL